VVKGQRKRKYTAEFKQGAVALVLNEKWSIPDAAAALGVPANTLNVWVSQLRNAKGVFLPDEQR
jgi:transposase-like protein